MVWQQINVDTDIDLFVFYKLPLFLRVFLILYVTSVHLTYDLWDNESASFNTYNIRKARLFSLNRNT